MDVLSRLFSEQSFMPHGHCYLWTPAMVWLQVITNSLIGLSYVAISLTLAGFMRRVRDVPFRLVYVAFGTFIIACGFTHFMDVWVIWEPRYWLDGGLRLVTAAASVGTAALLPRFVPRAVNLTKSTQRMRKQGVALEAALDDLGTLYQRTRELDQMKTDFFANVSHELRTPLTLILAPVESLLRTTDLPEQARAQLSVVERNARVLLGHVNDLLDIQKVDAGQLRPHYSDVDVVALVNETVASFAPLAREKGIQLHTQLPSALRAELDSAQIRRVLVNLLSNALKFTPAAGTVTIRLEAVPANGRERAEVLMHVSDTGRGIAPEDRERIFQRYAQASGDPHLGAAGTGLGLAIVRDLVTLHGGTVGVSDAASGGALFIVRLPEKAPAGSTLDEAAHRVDVPTESAPLAASRRLPSEAEPGPGERATVLVADDNDDMRQLLASMLSPHYRVIEARDGADALRLARGHLPDLIVSDMMMPRLSGEELVYAVRADASLDGIPVLLLTAKAEAELRARLLQRGAHDYVVKPFEYDELVARVQNLVTMRRTQQLLQSELTAQHADVLALTREVLQQKHRIERALREASAARELAEHASRKKSEFLSLVSHELRTPITSVRLQVERLTRGLTGAINEAQVEVIGKISRATSRLLEMVDALLQFGRLEAGNFPVEHTHVDVLAVAAEVVDDFCGRAEAAQLRIRLECEHESAGIVGDPRLVRLILSNLCDNALKYTDAGDVVVTVERLPHAAVRASVRDTGRGIPSSAHARVFEPFEQLEDVRHKQRSGVGLGLALVRQMADVLGAVVALESDEGVGSCFSVTFRGDQARAQA